MANRSHGMKVMRRSHNRPAGPKVGGNMVWKRSRIQWEFNRCRRSVLEATEEKAARLEE